MLSAEEALRHLLDACRPVTDTDIVATLDATGRVLAADQRSGLDVPPMDNTQMDGYAVRAVDCESGEAVLPLSQRIPEIGRAHV